MRRDEEKEALHSETIQKNKDDKMRNMKKKIKEIEESILEKRKDMVFYIVYFIAFSLF